MSDMDFKIVPRESVPFERIRDTALQRSRRRLWTEEEDNILINHYADTPIKVIMDMLPGRTRQAIYGRVDKLGVKKSEDFLLEQNRKLGKAQSQNPQFLANRFKKGHVPVNKGMKLEEYMTPEQIEKSVKTRFKKGNKPANTLYDGAITIRHSHQDRGASPYLWIRIAEGEWIHYHRYQWEKKNGPVPPDHIIVFKDGDTMNTHPENLECITFTENARRNSNPEKAVKTRQEIRSGKRKPKKITDYQAANRLAGGDRDLRRFLLDNRRDLVQIAKLNYQLKREIHYAKSN